MIKFLIFILIFFTAFYYNFYYNDLPEKMTKKINHNTKIFLYEDFSNLKDTIWTTKSIFIEADLKNHVGKIYFKNDSIKFFKLSAGTDKLKDGIKTSEGIFIIKSKLPQWHSIQFDSTLMLNWMGFSFGVGFHALAGNGYYRFLGKRASSHGCIRLSREDAKDIYNQIELGTPVLVHYGNNAVTIGFAEPKQKYLTYTYKELKSSLTARFESLYNGKYFIDCKEKLLIDNNVWHAGLPIGDNSKVPSKQLILKSFQKDETTMSDLIFVKNVFKITPKDSLRKKTK